MAASEKRENADRADIHSHSGDVRGQRDANVIKTNTRVCPICHQDQMEYDGCLNLTCPDCGFTQSGGGYT